MRSGLFDAHNVVQIEATKTKEDWMTKPEFVSSFENETHVYFFFRDVDTDGNEKSFVGRVCKNDTGQDEFSKGIWTTWSRAVLDCSWEGTTYNALKAVYRSQWDEPLYHAAFSGGGSKSAVCVYDIADIKRTFEGKYREAASADPGSERETCGKDTQTFSKEIVEYVHTNTIIEDAVPCVGGRPLYMRFVTILFSEHLGISG